MLLAGAVIAARNLGETATTTELVVVAAIFVALEALIIWASFRGEK